MASNYNRKSASSGSRKPRGRAAGGYRAAPAARTDARSQRNTAQRSFRVPRSNPVPRANPVPRSNPVPRANLSGSYPGASRDGVHLRSVRVGDARASRNRRMGSAKPSVRSFNVMPVLIAVCVVVAVLVVSFLVLRASNVFEIEDVSVTGVEHLTSEEMMALIAVPEGTTLLQVDKKGIEDRLLKDAWIEKAKVSAAFPHTLKVEVTERVIRAVVEVPSEDGSEVKRWAIASDGMWLMPIPDQDSEAGRKTSQQIYDDIAAALVITDVPYSTKPEMGTYCNDPNVTNALEVVVGLTTDLSDQVKSVAATETESTTITLDNGIEIVFGSSDNIRDKERVCLKIMEEYEGSLAYINVSDPKSPTWRAL